MTLLSKNKSPEYNNLQSYSVFLRNILLSDQYISKKDYLKRYDSLAETISKFDTFEKDNILINWCKKNKTNYKKLLSLIAIYKNTEKEIKKHNRIYVNIHLKKDKEYLDNVLFDDDPNIKLDEEQRRVVLSDEDYTLVIAGAGAGKTTTIEAKVKFS